LQISIFDLSPIELGFKILLNVGEFETAEIICTRELIAMHANERPRRPYARPGNELISYLLENRSANSKNKEEGLLCLVHPHSPTDSKSKGEIPWPSSATSQLQDSQSYME
jgi:hypothetical protein